MAMKTSDKGIELLKRHEGLELEPYRDAAGFPTIGYGHLLSRDKDAPLDEFEPLQSEEEAVELLRQDLQAAEQAVRQNVQTPLSQEQFDALASFTFNVGAGAFKNSTMLRRINEGNFQAAAGEFNRWVFAGGQRLDGLANRRRAEAELFKTGLPAPEEGAPEDPFD